MTTYRKKPAQIQISPDKMLQLPNNIIYIYIYIYLDHKEKYITQIQCS